MRDASGAQFVRATMAAATSSAGQQLLPSYKQHTSVDDRAGLIVDIEVVTGEEADFGGMVERPDAVDATLGRRTGTVTSDKAYGIAKVYAAQSTRPSRSGPVGAALSERPCRSGPVGAGHCCRDPAPPVHAPSQSQRLSHSAHPL